MMKQVFHTFQKMLGILGLMYCLTQCNTYEPIVNIKIVNKKDPTQSIAGAKVSIKGSTETTDTNGIAWMDINLDRFILDRVEVSASAKGYRDSIGTILVGKDQQETIVIALEPRNQLVYTPNPVIIGPNEVFRDIKVKNLGLGAIPVDYNNNNFAWISLSPKSDIIKSDVDGQLRVTANVSQQNCRADGIILAQWTKGGQQQSDSILITKIIPDSQPPFATFSVSPALTVTQNVELTFDASGSTDNCKAYFPLQYNWILDNNNQSGFSPDLVTFKHTYSEIGTKNVSLIVRDGAGLETPFSREIHVVEQPTPPNISQTMTVSSGPDLLSVVLSGSVINFGQTFNSLIDHGFVYATNNPTPTLENGGFPVRLGDTTAFPQQITFSTILQNLQPKRHYFRAFAQNAGFPPVYSDVFIYDVKIVDFIPVGGSGGSLFQAQRGDNDSPFADQKPESYVYLNNFQITDTEVTNEQYAAFLNGNNIPPNQSAMFIALGTSACKVEYTNKYSVIPGFEKYPVVTITWGGANAFCTWVNGRLPTEAEWEAAARADATPVYPQWSGSNVSPGLVAVYNGNSNQLLPVKQRAKNAWGLYDMSGNAAEWCSDWYASQYAITPSNNPQGPATGTNKVFRGGSYLNGPDDVTVTFRNRESPILQLPYLGFRVLRN